MLFPFNRRERTLNNLMLFLASTLHDVHKTNERSVSALSIRLLLHDEKERRKFLTPKNIQYFDLLNAGIGQMFKLDPLRVPIRSVGDALNLCRIATENFNLIGQTKLSWNWNIRTVTRKPPPPSSHNNNNEQDCLIIADATLIKTEDDLDYRYQMNNQICLTYLDYKQKIMDEYNEHSRVLDRLENATQCNTSKRLWRRNQKRGTERMLILLEHLSNLHYSQGCPYC
jgi:hypothetical protein